MLWVDSSGTALRSPGLTRSDLKSERGDQQWQAQVFSWGWEGGGTEEC